MSELDEFKKGMGVHETPRIPEGPPADQDPKRELELFLANRNPKDMDGGECERISQPSKPPEIETENIFDPELLNRPDPAFLEEMGGFLDNPMGPVMKMLTQYMETFKPSPIVYDPPPQEHKVRIFCLDRAADLHVVEREIESYLNNGYRGFPTVCNDFLIMDFSRRKESEENGSGRDE